MTTTHRTLIVLATLLVAPSTRAYHGVVPPATDQGSPAPCCAPGMPPCEQDAPAGGKAPSPSEQDDSDEPVFTDQG